MNYAITHLSSTIRLWVPTQRWELVVPMGGGGVFILFTERMDLRSHPGIFTFLINLVLFILDCRYLPDQPHPSKVRYTRVTPIAQTPR